MPPARGYHPQPAPASERPSPGLERFAASSAGKAAHGNLPARNERSRAESLRMARDKAWRETDKERAGEQVRSQYEETIRPDALRCRRNAQSSNARRASSYDTQRPRNRNRLKAGTSSVQLYWQAVRQCPESFARTQALARA